MVRRRPPLELQVDGGGKELKRQGKEKEPKRPENKNKKKKNKGNDKKYRQKNKYMADPNTQPQRSAPSQQAVGIC